MKHIAMAARVAAAVFCLGLFGAPVTAGSQAWAQDVPNAFTQEALIKTALLTFNDANLTGNYDVMAGRVSKPFRDQFPPARLATTFKSFRDQHVNLNFIAPMQPVASEPPKVDGDGHLTLKGYFATTPNRTYYDLAFVISDGEWKIVGMDVDFRKPDK